MQFFSFILIVSFILANLETVYGFAEEWTLEQKVGQLLMVHFNGSEINQEAQELVKQAHVGGFIYYQWANELSSPQQVQQLSNQLQQLAKESGLPPLLIAIDQEGGAVTRLKKGFTVFPGNQALAQTRQPSLAQACAKAMGDELKAVGINMNLAPVVDVNSNPRNPVIGIRAFSNQPQEVALFAERMLQGYHQAGIIPVLKHFPGHGDVSVDSHEALPVVKKSLLQLNQTDLVPFRKLASQADVIMTAHLFVPALDPKQCVTLSKEIIQKLLRQQMQFNHIVMTDSLMMQAILDQCYHIEEAAIQSVEAGHDLILLGGKQLNQKQNGAELKAADVLRIHQALVAAVRQGRISQERLEASFQRILNLKHRYHLSEQSFTSEQLKLVGTEVHHELANQIASEALTILSSQPLPNLKGKKVAGIAPAILESEFSQIESFLPLIYFDALNPNDQECQSLLDSIQSYESYIFFSYNSWKNSNQVKIVKALQKAGKSVVIVAVRDPQDANEFSHVEALLCTYSPVAASLRAALNRLFREVP